MALPFPDISPDAFVIPVVGWPIRWYALAYIAGLLAGWRIIVALMRRPGLWGGTAPMAPEQVEDLLTAVILGTILGGRIGYILFYDLPTYLADPMAVVRVWEGGMAFHGGFLGVVMAGLWFCRRNRVSALAVGDAFALVAPLGLFLGRLANFIKPELWGRPTGLPWGVVFPVDAAQVCNGWAGQVDGFCARHPSQLYEAGLEGLVLGGVLWVLMARGALRQPGRIMGVFLVGYGLARAFVELFRQPDAQFASPGNPMGYIVQLGDAGVTMGQLLSAPMILVGLIFVLRARGRG